MTLACRNKERNRRPGLAVKGAFLGTALACASPSFAAFAQQTDDPLAKPRPSHNAILSGCAADHKRYCSREAAATSADIACLKQHYLNLTLKCRNQFPSPDPLAAGGFDQGAAAPGTGTR